MLVFMACCREQPTNGIEDLSNPLVQPRVIFTAPAAHTLGPFDNLFNPIQSNPHFILRFNKLMRKGSFKPGSVSAVGFDRPVAVSLYSSYYFNDPKIGFQEVPDGDEYYNDLLEFTINDSMTHVPMNYHVGQMCTIIVGENVEDINGNQVATPFTFSFTPEPYFRVIGTNPKDGSSDNSIGHSEITVQFNSPVTANIFAATTITPQTDGNWEVSNYDPSVVSFLVWRIFLSFNTEYALTINSGVTDVYANPLRRKYSSSFKTAPFKVRYSIPNDGESGVGLYSHVYVQFNSKLDTNTIRPSFSLTPYVAGTISLQFNGFVFNPESELQSGTTYTLSLSTDVQAFVGTHLLAPALISFTTAEFRLVATIPHHAQEDVSRSESIYMQFNALVDTGSIRQAFTISPPTEGQFISTDSDVSFAFDPNALLAPNTTYSVTISSALKTRAGNPLSSSYSFSFITVE